MNQQPAAGGQITLNQMRYFVRTAELGSMTATSAEMFVAQSAISAAIGQLEESLGCQLLIRQRARGVVLTEAGSTFYASARTVLDGVDEAVGALRGGQLRGRLTAGCFTTLAPFWLPEIFERHLEAHPALEVRLREITAEQVEPLLRQRELDVVLTYDFDYGRNVDFEVLAEAPVYAAVAPQSPLASYDDVDLATLAGLPMILLDMGKSTNYFLSIFRDAHLRPTIHRRFESFEVVRSMVGRGHGYTILNQRPAHDLTNDGGRLVRVPIRDVTSSLQVGVAHRSGEPLSGKGRAFVEVCRAALQDSPEGGGAASS